MHHLPPELDAQGIAELPEGDPVRRLLDGIQSNFTAYCGLFARPSGPELRREHGVTWCCAGDEPPGDHVLACDLSHRSVDEDLTALLAQFEQRSTWVEWVLYPSTRPRDLGRRLARRGLIPQRVLWMLADLDALPDPAALGEFRVHPVTDPAGLDRWVQTFGAAFRLPASVTEAYAQAYARLGSQNVAVRHFLGYWRDRPVTTATLLVCDGMAGLYDIGTLAQYRRRGFATAVTREVLAAARRVGCTAACLMAASQGEGAYERAGFGTRVVLADYVWQPESR